MVPAVHVCVVFVSIFYMYYSLKNRPTIKNKPTPTPSLLQRFLSRSIPIYLCHSTCG